MGLKIKMKNILDVGTSIVLRKLGFGKFDNLRRLISIEEYGGEVPDMDLWLIPADKYDEIPKGYPVTDIFGKTAPFEGSKTCCKNDVGPGGMLPIGVLRPAEAGEENCSCEFITAKAIMLDGKLVEAGTECTDARMLIVAVESLNKHCKGDKDFNEVVEELGLQVNKNTKFMGGKLVTWPSHTAKELESKLVDMLSEQFDVRADDDLWCRIFR